MKKKHRVEKWLSSIFGTHVDPENNEALNDEKEVEKNMEKILKLLSGEETGSDSGEKPFDKSELASLVNEFYKGYRALHGRYDHLIGKLKRTVHQKRGSNGNFSFHLDSSDSESSDSGSEDLSELREKSNRNQKVETEPKISLEDYNSLHEQLGTVKIRNNELETRAVSMLKEWETVASRLADREATILTLENKVQTMSKSIEVLQVENGVQKQDLEASLEQRACLDQQIGNLCEENEYLKSENSTASRSLREADKTIEESKIAIQQLEADISELECKNSSLKEELNKATEEITDVNQRLAILNDEKEALRSENLVILSEKQETEKDNSNLKLSIEDLSFEKEKLEAKLEAADRQGADLLEKMAATGKIIEDLTIDFDLLKGENSKLLDINHDLDQQLREVEGKNSVLSSKELEAIEKFQKAEEMIEILSMEVQKLKNNNSQILLNCEGLKLELESANQETFGLRQSLEAKEDEKQLLTSENLDLLSKLKQMEKTIDDLKADREKLEIDDSQLQIKLNDLILELEASNVQLNNLNKVLAVTEREKHNLILEISMITSKLQQAEISIKQLENEAEHLREENLLLQQSQVRLEEAEKIINDFKAENEILRAENSQLHDKISVLTLEPEGSNLQLIDLNKLLEASAKEKNELTLEIETVTSSLQQVQVKTNELENDIEKLRETNCILQQHADDLNKQNTELQRRLEETGAQILALHKELEEVKKEASNELHTTMVHANNLQVELDLLQNKNRELEDENKFKTDRVSESQFSIKNMEAALTNKISNMEAALTDQKDNFVELFANYKQLEGHFQQSCAKLERAEKKIEEMEEKTMHRLEMVDKGQKQEISKLEESCIKLDKKFKLFEVEKLDLDKEITKLSGQVQTLEVQLRLSNQKLKVTETENKEKEDYFKKLVQELQEEQRKLDEQVRTSSGKIRLLENEFNNMKDVAKNWVLALKENFQELEVVFEQYCGFVKNRLGGCTEELKVAKAELAEHLSEKQELMNEKHELTVRLKYKDGMFSMLKDQVQTLKANLAEKEMGEEKLMTRMSEYEKKMGELETRLRQQEAELLAKDEEKKEAIRQLCLLIEYHRENCNHLYHYLSATVKRSRR